MIKNSAGLLDLIPRGESSGIRSPGTHVSDVIRDISNTILKPGQREKYDTLSPAEKVRMGNYTAMGWAWEQMVHDALIKAGLTPGPPARFVRAEEIALDGLHGNPDWLDMEQWQDVELKATWRSSARPLEDFWEWLTQFKAYCKMLGCTSTRLLVFYVNGDYKKSGPEYRDLTVSFGKQEIEDNWEMLKNHAKAKGWVPGHGIRTEARGASGKGRGR
jgi:hypothetical protein